MDAFVSNRLDKEPAIFRGCSLSELMLLVIGSLLFCVPFFLLLLSMIGYPMMGCGIGVVASIITILIGGNVLQKLKRGRPNGYYQAQIRVLLVKFKFKKADFLMDQNRIWSVGRLEHQQMSISNGRK